MTLHYECITTVTKIDVSYVKYLAGKSFEFYGI